MHPDQAKAQFKALLQLPDQMTLLEEACLLMCVLAGDDLEPASDRAANDPVGAVEPTFQGVVSALFGADGLFHGNSADYYSIDNSLLTRVRRAGTGLPITLCVQALCTAQRLGVAMVGIGMPGHFIIRAGDNEQLFADPFHGDAVFDAGGARALFEKMTGSSEQWQDAFLNPVTAHDILYRMLNNMRVATMKNPHERIHLPWILELASWFPQGPVFDPVAVAKMMAPFN